MAHTIRIDGSNVMLAINGRLDAATSPALESELKQVLDGPYDVTIDLSGLDYISSAGLRVLLVAFKRVGNEGSVRAVNASGYVLELLEETGFAEILGVSR